MRPKFNAGENVTTLEGFYADQRLRVERSFRTSNTTMYLLSYTPTVRGSVKRFWQPAENLKRKY